MAGVPEYKFPMIQAEPTPVPEPVEPPRLSMGEAAGRGLSQVGEELYGVGQTAYHRAAEARAQEKETEFQKRALQLRDQYRNLYLFDAVKAHEKFSDDLEKARSDIGKTVGTKSGQILYMNNSLRNSRFVQESIDSHFEQQSRAYQDKTYADWQQGQNTLLASKAADARYNPADVEKILQDKYDRAVAKGTSRGMDPESAKQFAEREAQKGADSLFSILTHKENPNRALAQGELQKYADRGWVDKTGFKDVLNTINSSNAKAWARERFVGLPREDGNHDPDPEGAVPHQAVLDAADKIEPTDTNRGAKVDALEAEWAKHQRDYELAGHELRRSVMTQGIAAGGGRFTVPTDSLDWQKLQRLHGDLAAQISDKATERDWRAWHRGRISAHEASREAAGAARYYLDRLSSEDVKSVTSAEVETILSKSYHGPGVEPQPEDKARTLEYLKKLQTGKADPVERQFNQIASQALEEAYKGNRQLVRAAMNRAYYFLDDTYSDSVRSGKAKSTAELRAALVDEFKKKNGIFGSSWFGNREGESYQRRGGVRQVTTEDEYKSLPSGARYRKPGDPADKWRVKP